MKKLIAVFLIGITTNLLAQSSKDTQYGAYIKASQSMWEKSIDLAVDESGKGSFEHSMALYGLLNNTMATQDKASFDKYLDQTVDLLKEIMDKQPTSGEPKAVLSSVYGLVMAYSPMKGMIYGAKSSSLMSEAVKQEPDSPLVQKLYAGSMLYTPMMWGGDPEIALKAFVKSVELYESSNTENNWLYLDALVGLAMAYQKTENPDMARATLNKVIEIEPQHGWARSILTQLGE